jgi:hypothetical protein
MNHGLLTDPAVFHVRIQCGLPADSVVGKLYALWSWADAVTVDGHVPGVNAEAVDEVVGWPGFAEALASVPGSPWLIADETGITLPNFDRHNGRSAKRRAKESVRKASARDADKMRTKSGPEKRREEERTTTSPTPPSSGRVKGRPKKARGPEVVALAEYLGKALRHWKPDIRLQVESASSLDGLDRLLRLDKRDENHVYALIDWLFLGDEGSYTPTNEFDWRSNVNSGATLRKHFDKLDVLYRKSLDPEES